MAKYVQEPSSFCIARSVSSPNKVDLKIKTGEFVQSTVIPIETSKQVKYLQRVLEMYWNRFKSVYLAELREYHMYTKSRKRVDENNRLQIGDVVIIKDDKITPRSSWRNGRVEKLIFGKDGHVRGAEIRSISTDGKRTKLVRPSRNNLPREIHVRSK